MEKQQIKNKLLKLACGKRQKEEPLYSRLEEENQLIFNEYTSSKRKIFCCFPPSDQHKGSPCVDLGLIYPRRHSCDLWGQSVTEQTGTDRNRKWCYCKRWEYPNCEKVQLTTTWIVCCWGVKTKMSECISKEKKRKKERIKNKVKPKRSSKTLLVFGDMQRQQKCISDGKQLQDISGSTAR